MVLTICPSTERKMAARRCLTLFLSPLERRHSNWMASAFLLIFMFAFGYWLFGGYHCYAKGLETGRGTSCPVLQLVSSKPRNIRVPYDDSPTLLKWLYVWLTLQVPSGSIKEYINKQTKNTITTKKDYLNYRDTLPVVPVTSYYLALFPQDGNKMLVTLASCIFISYALDF